MELYRYTFDDVVMEFATDKKTFHTSEVAPFWGWWVSGKKFPFGFKNFLGVIIKKCQDERMSLAETDIAISEIFADSGDLYGRV
jgi:hypothetical protein